MKYVSEFKFTTMPKTQERNLKRFFIIVSANGPEGYFGGGHLATLSKIIADIKLAKDDWSQIKAEVISYIQFRCLVMLSEHYNLKNIRFTSIKSRINPSAEEIAAAIVRGKDFLILEEGALMQSMELITKELGKDCKFYSFS